MANFKYHAEGQESQTLRRDVCTPGTRVRILDVITTWAKSAGSEPVYWLFGSVGSGKSTIAYTIATQTTRPTSLTPLGGNFFCSRQFESTRHSKRVIPTIAYHLAHQCPAFAETLAKCDFDVAQQNPRAQIKEFLVKPWLQSTAARASDPYSSPSYLLIIDALDEIEANGGPDFLRDLVDAINMQQLPGLKFLITSRPDPSIVDYVNSLNNKQLYRLEETPSNEAEAEIETYLNAKLPRFKGSELLHQLIQLAAGLFIFAATVVKHLDRYPSANTQRDALKKLISTFTHPNTTMTPSATQALDRLYLQVLEETFQVLAEELIPFALHIVHTLLSTAEPTSTAVVTSLVDEDGPSSEPSDNPTEFADNVVKLLYSVLYVDNGIILAYHKSFADFIFNEARSDRFWCEQTTHNRFLASSCLRLMTAGLCFNIANIPSSYVLNCENPDLQDEVHLEKTIPFDLRYAGRHWAYHLERTGPHSNKNTPLLSSLADFLQLRALFWIEAMSVLGCAGSCDPILRTAYDFVPHDRPALQQALGEAANFSLYFSGSDAPSSTPHLYISALSTYPYPSSPVSEWKSHFHTLPQFTSSQARSPALMEITVGSPVEAVAISNNGSLIVSCGWDSFVRIWDGSTGRLLHVLEGHALRVIFVSFFRDDTQVVSASYDGIVRIWDVRTARELRVLGGYGDFPIHSAAISPDGARIASGSYDGSIRIWNADTECVLKVLEGHRRQIEAVAFSHAPTRWICSGSDDNTVRIWDVERGEVLHVFELPPRGSCSGVACVCFSPNDSYIVTGSDEPLLNGGRIVIWDPATGQQQEAPQLEGDSEGDVTALDFARDGSKMVVGTKDGKVQILDCATWAVIGSMEGHQRHVSAVTFSADGTRVPSASPDSSIRVWRAVSALTPQPQSPVPSARITHLPPGVRLGRVAISHDGTKIVGVSVDNTRRLWDATTGNLLRVLQGDIYMPTRIYSVAFSTDDRRILCAVDDDTVQVWDVSTGDILKRVEYEASFDCASISRSGARMIASSGDVARIWDVSTGQVVQVLGGISQEVGTVALSCNGKYAGIGFENKTQIWDISTEQPQVVWALEGQFHDDDIYFYSGLVTSIAFSADCSRVASVAGLGHLSHVWDMVTGTCLWALRGHTDSVSAIALSPTGRTLASCGWDKTVRLWDTSTGEVQEILEEHTASVNDVVFSSDGRKVISCSDDGSIRFWSVSPPNIETNPYRIQKILDPSSGQLRPTGWLLKPDNDHLLVYIQTGNMVPNPYNTLIIPPSANSSVSFKDAALGSTWPSCYSNPKSSLIYYHTPSVINSTGRSESAV